MSVLSLAFLHVFHCAGDSVALLILSSRLVAARSVSAVLLTLVPCWAFEVLCGCVHADSDLVGLFEFVLAALVSLSRALYYSFRFARSLRNVIFSSYCAWMCVP